MKENVNIFYSWQSDLVGNQTKWLINEVIDELVSELSDTLTIYADRDTKNCDGSPDIVKTILSKISQSDLFIADVSIVGYYNNERYTSNPNVLFELGYAASIIGWDNIICIMNTDYGCVEQLPFDIRQHRILTYSIDKDGRSKAKKQLKDILKGVIMNARYNEKPSSDKVQYNIGCYNFNTNKVEKRLIPINIKENEYVLNFKSNANNKIKELIELIKVANNNKMICSKLEGLNLIKLQDQLTSIQDIIQDYTGTTVDDNFFYIGNLSYDKLSGKIYGTEDAKTKFNYFRDIICEVRKLNYIEKFIDMFNNTYIFQLAVHNNSFKSDEFVDISLEINDISTQLGNLKYNILLEDSAAIDYICKNKLIENILRMPENRYIKYNEIDDMSDNALDSSEIRRQLSNNMSYGINSINNFKYTLDDLIEKLNQYIVLPVDINNNVYECRIHRILAGESQWVKQIFLLRPKTDKNIKLKYYIKSKNSDGSMQGILEYKTD